MNVHLVGPYKILDPKGDCKTEGLFCQAHYKNFCIGWTGWKEGAATTGLCGQWLAVDKRGPDPQYHYWMAPETSDPNARIVTGADEAKYAVLDLGPIFEVDLTFPDMHHLQPYDFNAVAGKSKQQSFKHFLDYLDHVKES